MCCVPITFSVLSVCEYIRHISSQYGMNFFVLFVFLESLVETRRHPRTLSGRSARHFVISSPPRYFQHQSMRTSLHPRATGSSWKALQRRGQGTSANYSAQSRLLEQGNLLKGPVYHGSALSCLHTFMANTTYVIAFTGPRHIPSLILMNILCISFTVIRKLANITRFYEEHMVPLPQLLLSCNIGV